MDTPPSATWNLHLPERPGRATQAAGVVSAASPKPRFPRIGAEFAGFSLLAELGRGSESRVYLARQQMLASRLVALKLAPLVGGEHLSLARLQHTNIVPLFLAEDVPARGLRLLCMPYLGGAT